ncbi:MAG: 3-isopropylmalate dehydrogenase [bacterium]
MHIVWLAGDGIGPEVIHEAKKVASWFNENSHLNISAEDGLLGGCATNTFGQPYPDETKVKVTKADAVMLGAVGGPQWDNEPFQTRPEQGLLDIRKDMDLFANLRPTFTFDALKKSSSLKPDIVNGLNLMIVRELIGGIYFGEPRGITVDNKGVKKGYNTASYTNVEAKRIATIAFEAAKASGKKVCSIDKANVLEASIVWREAVQELRNSTYPEIELSHMYVDNAAMQLATKPQQFEIMLCPNLMGDILSDLGGALTGSLGMLPSASITDKNAVTGYTKGLYEPVHGSAPDIAGQNIANPIATILSFAMLLEYSLKEIDLAKNIKKAVEIVLNDGYRTADIMTKGQTQVTTSEMGDKIVLALSRLTTKTINSKDI